MTAPSSHLKNSTETYLSLPMMTDSIVLKHGILYVNCIPFHLTYSPLQFQIVHFPLNIFPPPIAIFIPLLTLLYILPLLTQLSCVCLPRFWLFYLFVYSWFGFLVVCLCIFVIWFSRCCWFSFVLQEQHFPSIPTYHFWRTKKLESNTSTDWIQTNHHPNAKNTANNL